MGQTQLVDGNTNNIDNSSRVPYDENGDNGLVLCNEYIPEEIIAEIMCYIDYKSLLNCQLVCKRWKNLLYDYVWRKKAEIITGQSLQFSKKLSWNVYYNLCKKNPIGRNLLKNHSGKNKFYNWKMKKQGGDRWKVEHPPKGVPPLPNDPVFENNNSCFVTSYEECSKYQLIFLENEGLSASLLDEIQPRIVVGEWYSGRWDCPSTYMCKVSLISNDNEVLDVYEFHDELNGDGKQNLWHHFEHEFKSYGPGLRKIVFRHSGMDRSFWAGHYGSKMAGGSVVVKLDSNLPDSTSTDDEEKVSVDVEDYHN